MQKIRNLAIVLLMVALPGMLLGAAPDVKKASSTKFEFKGTLGTMMKLFGANKPNYQVEYLKGMVKRVDNVDKKGKIQSSQIFDLERELIISIDYKKKKYTEMTFEQWREMIKSSMAGIMQQQEQAQQEAEQSEQQKPEVNLKFDVSFDRPGDTDKIDGKEVEKVVMTMKATADVEATDEETGEKQAARGGMIITNTNWITRSADGLEEEMAFNKLLAEKLGMLPGKSGFAEMMGAIMKQNPDLAAALEKLQEESGKIEGLPMRSQSVIETWGESDQKPEEEKASPPKSLGGLFKGLGKKMAKKDDDGGNKVLMETQSEISSYSTDPLSSDVFAVPAKFKREELKMPKQQ
ncbi:MAG: hypothetical protein H6695_06815 [Deferribacteres bacterium]|nr:hypothetical protein [candidate division KSB1 bacterium]MCB9509874.1 hypothetical protein [Deferribacteres bacterium]